MARKSLDQYSIGPNGVDAQSTERAKRMWPGSEGEMASLVQSKKPMSWLSSDWRVSCLWKESTSPAVWARNTHSFMKELESSIEGSAMVGLGHKPLPSLGEVCLLSSGLGGSDTGGVGSPTREPK